MQFLKIILSPFILPYMIIIWLRNRFFDTGIFKSKKVGARVISVGNITLGGSGKTPAVIYITTLLKNEGVKVGVLSRGYGRNSKGYLLVSDGNQILADVDKCGDEIYQTAKECKVPAAVSENRVEGAQKFIKDTGVEVIVLDDAFQHRWIKRDIDLLVFGQRFLNKGNFLEQSLLPLGEMREFFCAVDRADAVILNRKFSFKEEINQKRKKYFSNKRLFNAHYHALEFIDVIKNINYPVEDFKGQRSLVVSGIANPVSFIKALEQTNVDTSNRLFFRDHKDYTNNDIQKIRKKFYTTNSYSVVTTQKDAVKLSHFPDELDDIDIYYLKIKMVVDEEEDFKKYIMEKLNSNK
jgi:tetraacyldisaccharide 4'-kinase